MYISGQVSNHGLVYCVTQSIKLHTL